jgi:hypothetical protein
MSEIMTSPIFTEKPTNRIGFLELLAISTLLVPKAGLNLQGIPLTVNLILVLALIIFCIFRNFHHFGLTDLILLSLILPWLTLSLSRSNALIESRTLRFGSVYWFLLVPFFWVSVECLRKSGRFISPKLVIFCSFGSTAFGIGQFLWGLNFLKISGLTIAWGDSYERKNLSIFSANTSIGTKIPSTFQGGNIWGQCSTLILIWVVASQAWRSFNSRLLRLASIISPIVAVFLSFSRTAVVSAAVTLAFYFLRDRRRALGFLALFSAVILIIVFASNLSLGRYSFESFTNSAGRSSQWLDGFTHFSISDWLFGRSTILPESVFYMEGILGLFGQVGIVGFILILVLWTNTFKGIFIWLGVASLICLILDSTYVTPPLLLIPSVLSLAKAQGVLWKDSVAYR